MGSVRRRVAFRKALEDRLDQRFDAIDQRFETMQAQVNERFTDVGVALEAVTTTLTSIRDVLEIKRSSAKNCSPSAVSPPPTHLRT